MYPAPKLDLFEKCLRFACGSLFGAIVAFAQIGMKVTAFGGFIWAAIGIAAIVCGWLAVRFEDDFWRGVVDRWFRRY